MESLWPWSCSVRSDGLEVMFTAESHMTAKAESGQLVRMGRLPLNDSGGGVICFDDRRGFNNTLKCSMFWCQVFLEKKKEKFKKQGHV